MSVPAEEQMKKRIQKRTRTMERTQRQKRKFPGRERQTRHLTQTKIRPDGRSGSCEPDGGGRAAGRCCRISGYREENDKSTISDWIQNNNPDLLAELPFLEEIPEDRIFGEPVTAICFVLCRGMKKPHWR